MKKIYHAIDYISGAAYDFKSKKEADEFLKKYVPVGSVVDSDQVIASITK